MAIDLVIDADGHYNEPTYELAKLLPAQYANRVPVPVKDPFYGSKRMWEGQIMGNSYGFDPGVTGPFSEKAQRDNRPGASDPLQRLPDMDLEGIDVAVVFGGGIAFPVNGLRDKGLAAAACHAVNRWQVEEYLAADPKRLKGAGIIPCQDAIAAAKELEWLGQQRKKGIVTAMMSTNVYGINLGDRRFDPIYETAEAIGIPLSVHPQTVHWGQYGIEGIFGAGCERLEKFSYVHLTAFTFELQIALMHMVGEGVFDRYPNLKVGYMEGSCGWLPYWTERLDEHFEKLRPQWPDCQRKPSEIIKGGQVILTCEPEEECLPWVLEAVAPHLVMYASDYPHWDCEFPESVHKLAAVKGMSDEQQRRVLGRNAIDWFGLTPDELPNQSVYFREQSAAPA